MKPIHTYEEFLNEAQLNEASLPQTIEEMEKILPKVVNIEEFLHVWTSYSHQFRDLDMESLLDDIAPKLDKKSLVLSQGQFVTYNKKRYEDGYGGNSKPAESKLEYDNAIKSEDWSFLISISSPSSNKFLKRVATEIQKSIGQLEAAKKVLIYAWSHAGDSYDRNLTMSDYYEKIGYQLWHDKNAVSNAVSKGFMSAGKNLVDSPWREYLQQNYRN